MTFADGLRRAIDAAGINQDELSKLLGVSRPAVSQWLSGTTTPAGRRLQQIAAALGTTVPRIFGETNNGDDGTVPVVGYVGGGEEIFPLDDGEMGGGLEHVPAPPGADETLVAVIVRGSSMVPAFWEGDLLFYTRDAAFDRSDCLYKECVVKVLDGPTYVKHVMPGASPTTFTLMSFNAPAIREVEIEWAAPVQFHDMRRRNAKTEMRELTKPRASRKRSA